MGSEDVDARIDMMRGLDGDFCTVAAGTTSRLRAVFQRACIEFHEYPMARSVDPFADTRTLLSLIRIFRRCRPSLVHAFDTKPCVLARLAGRLAAVPVVIGTLPGLGSLYATEGITTRLVRTVYEKLQKLACHVSDMTIFQNQEDVKEFVRRGIAPAPRTMVIPGSGVRTDLLDRSRYSVEDRLRTRLSLGLHPDGLVVTMVSRLIRSKGVKEFAAAAQTVSAAVTRVQFLLVGPVDDSSIERIMSDELSEITRSVKWVGLRNDVPEILAASDVFVLPSFYSEGVPRALLEAASMGLPIVTTHSPGCTEVVEDGVNGFLVPRRDIEALGEAITRLAREPYLRKVLGEDSRRRAVARFDVVAVTSQIKSVYLDLLSRRGSASDGKG